MSNLININYDKIKNLSPLFKSIFDNVEEQALRDNCQSYSAMFYEAMEKIAERLEDSEDTIRDYHEMIKLQKETIKEYKELINLYKEILANTKQSTESPVKPTLSSDHSKERAHWKFWDGWSSNHDQRIDDATCSACGYNHYVVYRSPKYLKSVCPGCHRTMEVKDC